MVREGKGRERTGRTTDVILKKEIQVNKLPKCPKSELIKRIIYLSKYLFYLKKTSILIPSKFKSQLKIDKEKKSCLAFLAKHTFYLSILNWP